MCAVDLQTDPGDRRRSRDERYCRTTCSPCQHRCELVDQTTGDKLVDGDGDGRPRQPGSVREPGARRRFGRCDDMAQEQR